MDVHARRRELILDTFSVGGARERGAVGESGEKGAIIIANDISGQAHGFAAKGAIDYTDGLSLTSVMVFSPKTLIFNLPSCTVCLCLLESLAQTELFLGPNTLFLHLRTV